MFTTEGPIRSTAATSGVRRLSSGDLSSGRGVWAAPVNVESARRLAAAKGSLDIGFQTPKNISGFIERNYQQFSISAREKPSKPWSSWSTGEAAT
jgi:hypothetical protein